MPLDPNLTAADLAQLAADRPDLRAEIAAHPAAYPELVSWITSQTPTPRRRRRWLAPVVIGSIVAVIALVAAIFIVPQIPQYPSTSPLQRDDLKRMVIELTGDDSPWEGTQFQRNQNSDWLLQVDPQDCSTIRAFGNSMFTGEEYAKSQDYDIRAAGEDGWVNARLFASESDLDDYVDEVSDVLDDCTTYETEDGEKVTTERVEPVEGVALSFRYEYEDSFTGVYVLVARDNALFVVQMDEYTDPRAGQWAEMVATA